MPHIRLTADDLSRLVAALRRCSLRGLSKLEHEHLSVLAQTVYEVGSVSVCVVPNPQAIDPTLTRVRHKSAVAPSMTMASDT